MSQRRDKSPPSTRGQQSAASGSSPGPDSTADELSSVTIHPSASELEDETELVEAAASERGLLKIGDLARLTQKTARTLHFYEELEILRPAERTRGGFRLYAPEAVTRIWLIERLQLLGLSLPEIRELLHGWEISATGSSAAHKVLSVLMTRRVQLQQELERLHKLERELDETVDYLRHCVSGCSAHTGPQACTQCAHAADEEVRPKMISGIYPFLA